MVTLSGTFRQSKLTVIPRHSSSGQVQKHFFQWVLLEVKNALPNLAKLAMLVQGPILHTTLIYNATNSNASF
jgi:hypothetical protein